MIKRAILVVAAMTLASCASAPFTYVRLDASPDQQRVDSTDCTHHARTNAPAPEARDRIFYHPDVPVTSRYALGSAERAAQVQANMYARCMTSRGYVRSA